MNEQEVMAVIGRLAQQVASLTIDLTVAQVRLEAYEAKDAEPAESS